MTGLTSVAKLLIAFVRFGSEADVLPSSCDVRYVPFADMEEARGLLFSSEVSLVRRRLAPSPRPGYLPGVASAPSTPVL